MTARNQRILFQPVHELTKNPVKPRNSYTIHCFYIFFSEVLRNQLQRAATRDFAPMQDTGKGVPNS